MQCERMASNAAWEARRWRDGHGVLLRLGWPGSEVALYPLADAFLQLGVFGQVAVVLRRHLAAELHFPDLPVQPLAAGAQGPEGVFRIGAGNWQGSLFFRLDVLGSGQ